MLEFMELKVDHRNVKRTKAVRKMRRDNFIPGILYGKGTDNVLLSVPKSECERVILKKGQRLVELVFPDTRQKGFLKEAQWDAVGEKLLHLDFQTFTESTEFEVDVPIKIKGEEECVGYKKGGVLRHLLHSLRVKGRLADLPEVIEVNAAPLDIGQKILVSELGLKKDLNILVLSDSVVVMVTEERKEEVAAETAPAAVLEGGTAAEPEIIKPERKKESEEEEDNK